MWCTSIEQHIFVPLSWPRLSTLPKTDWSKEWFPPKPQSTLPTYTGALGTDTGGHRGKSIVKSVSLTFNFSKTTKTIHINRKEILIRFHKPLRQDFQMQAIFNRCFPTAKNQLFLFCNCTCLKWLYSIQWGGQEPRMGNPGKQEAAPWVHTDLSFPCCGSHHHKLGGSSATLLLNKVISSKCLMGTSLMTSVKSSWSRGKMTTFNAGRSAWKLNQTQVISQGKIPVLQCKGRGWPGYRSCRMGARKGCSEEAGGAAGTPGLPTLPSLCQQGVQAGFAPPLQWVC